MTKQTKIILFPFYVYTFKLGQARKISLFPERISQDFMCNWKGGCIIVHKSQYFLHKNVLGNRR